MTQKDTRWKKGVSGNPAGRKPGSGWIGSAREQLQKAWDDEDGIRSRLIAKAKEGDMGAMRIVAERVLPALKAAELPTPMHLPEGSLTKQAEAVLAAVSRGEVPAATGAQLLGAIGSMARVMEIDELKERIEALERAAKEKQ